MAQSQDDVVLAKIRQYAAQARSVTEAELSMDIDASDTEARLENTVKDLQAQVDKQKAALERLRAESNGNITCASADPREKLRQLRILKATFASLKPTVPFLPAEGSLLPTMLTARTSQDNIRGTKEAIASTAEQITTTEGTLRLETANLRDASILTKAMEQRIERLRTQRHERSRKTPAQLAKELIAAKRAHKQDYEEKMKQLSEDFHQLITNILAPMLAAEEMGGPVVGDMPDIEDEALAIGFTNKGKAKNSKKTPSDGLRQRKIDQIWGDKAVLEDEEHLTEAGAADNEMRRLVEDLFAVLTGPGGGKAYYDLERDSAASRFLVRAKIAQFHPKNAKKLRLIDFGRELDD